MLQCKLSFVIGAIIFSASHSHAAEVKVLSAGAVEPGLHAFAKIVAAETGHSLAIQFNTAPQIAKRLADGDRYDILIAPPGAVTQAGKEGKVAVNTRTPVGRVGAGVIVRNAAAAPPIATMDELKAALLAADSVVYNTASTGLYLDRLFEQAGILAALKPKTTRYANGASVMEHIIKGKGNEIGFGAITEIRMFESQGLRLVGPLPASVQNYTSYEAVMMSASAAPEPVAAVLRLLNSPAGKAAFAAGGVE
jgi:molybdate transport system substrate-binding protein